MAKRQVVKYEELLAKHGFYYDLYMSQFRCDIDFSEDEAAQAPVLQGVE